MDLEQKKEKRLEMILVNKEDLKETIEISLAKFFKEYKAEKTWITQDDLKEMLSVKSSTTIQAMRDKGLIEFTNPSKKLILYKKSSVLEYLEKHSNKTF